MQPGDEPQGSAVRVVELRIADPLLAERLFGPGADVASCEVIFRYMMPAPTTAILAGVLDHGLSLTYEAAGEQQPRGLLVPWTQIAYLRYF